MHLGRFHAVIEDLDTHFKDGKIVEALTNAANELDAYASNRSEEHLTRFREWIGKAREAGNIGDRDLQQPFAQQVINELGVMGLLNPDLSKSIDETVARVSFDAGALSAKLREFASILSTRIKHITRINASFGELNVELERVDSGQSELGLLLPREIVGDKLSELSAEFDKIDKLARAISEIVASADYDPKVRTISSSWWQIFLDLTVVEISAWVFAIERIVALLKSNLEIKLLNKQLGDKNLPDDIVKRIDDAVKERVKQGIHQLASDLRQQHGKTDDDLRMNELETQLRQGLTYLTNRLNQGAQIEINIAIPHRPTEPTADEGKEVDPVIAHSYKQDLEQWRQTVLMRERAQTVSALTEDIDSSESLLLESDSEKKIE